MINFAVIGFESVQDKHQSAVLSGGWDATTKNFSSEAHVQDMITGQWRQLPSLNVARQVHASTVLHNYIFVVAGWNGKFLNSIEYLDMSKWEMSEPIEWKLFTVEVLSPRTLPAFSALNAT